jgi:hypothetical protein
MTEVVSDLDILRRWELAGGHWQVLHRAPSRLVLSLQRCDGGEEVQRLTTTAVGVVEYVADRESSVD